MCNKDCQDFGKFNSRLGNILTDSRSNMSLSSCLLFMLMRQHLDMYIYKVQTQGDDLPLLFNIAIYNRSEDRRYLLNYLLMFQLHI